jgi:hypothetical protein
LLRVVLPDKPGMLGAVASALGKVKADILSVDVVERSPGIAVDDMVVEPVAGGLPDALVSAAQSVHGVWVESIRRYAGALDTQRELELIEAMTGEADRATAILVGGLPRIFRAGWCLLLRPHNGSADVLARSHAAPAKEGTTLTDVKLERAPARIVDPEVDTVPDELRALDTELAVSPFEAGLLLLGRPGGPAFRTGEVARFAHLAGIAATITSGITR